MISDEQAGGIASRLPESAYLRAYVTYGYRRSEAPLIYHIGTALSHLSAVSPINLHASLTNPVYGNTFVMLVGESGQARKTTAMVLGDDILRDVAPKRIGPQPASWEGCIDGLADHPVQLIRYPEMATFLSASSGESSQNYYAKLRKTYTDLYDCQPQTRQKAKGRGSVSQANPRLSLFGACAPPFLAENTTAEDWNGGFLGRWLMFTGIKTRTIHRPPQWIPMRDWLRSRLKLLFDAGARPMTYPWIGFDTEAAAIWDQWLDDMPERYKKVESWAQSAASRMPVSAMKLCLLLSMDASLNSNGEIIPGTALSGDGWHFRASELSVAIALVEAHLSCTIEILENMPMSLFERKRLAVLRAMGDKHLVTESEIVRNTRPRMFLDDLRRVLATMVAGEDVRLVSVGANVYYTTQPPEVTGENKVRSIFDDDGDGDADEPSASSPKAVPFPWQS